MLTKLPEMKTIAINLMPFYLKRVAVTLRNGDVFTGVIKEKYYRWTHLPIHVV